MYVLDRETGAAAPRVVAASSPVGARPNFGTMALSSDGLRILTGGDTETADLWDARTGAHLALLSGHTSRIHAVAFDPQGSRLVTAGGDATVRLWGDPTGEELNVLKAHQGAVYAVAVRPDGNHLATGGADNTAKLWSMATGRLEHTLSAGRADAVSLCFSPDGGLLLMRSSDHCLLLWDVRTGELVTAIAGPPSGSGDRGTTFARPLALRRSDRIGTGRRVQRFSGLERGVVVANIECRDRSIAFSPDSRRVAFGILFRSLLCLGAVLRAGACSVRGSLVPTSHGCTRPPKPLTTLDP